MDEDRLPPSRPGNRRYLSTKAICSYISAQKSFRLGQVILQGAASRKRFDRDYVYSKTVVSRRDWQRQRHSTGRCSAIPPSAVPLDPCLQLPPSLRVLLAFVHYIQAAIDRAEFSFIYHCPSLRRRLSRWMDPQQVRCFSQTRGARTPIGRRPSGERALAAPGPRFQPAAFSLPKVYCGDSRSTEDDAQNAHPVDVPPAPDTPVALSLSTSI